MRNLHQFIRADTFLIEAAQACRRAGKACRRWEQGGPSDVVGDTAELALAAFNHALSAAEIGEPIALFDQAPETRQARLILAGYLLLAAGTDEDGESADLMLAAKILRAAAIA
ncbi:hypothetical protein DAH66_06290 [Sphingomonas koreensis]|uniref:Uncharacterized protein n=1 Tax=Sphingomonas koreensis TaxID=93064 RepID=A0A430G6D6_9SPHN|nr:hypothetical protein [Sphingomonas koreensis]RSY88062.1 hypothetical protein DAH66_06290 [Sphingomonas koreensis]